MLHIRAKRPCLFKVAKVVPYLAFLAGDEQYAAICKQAMDFSVGSLGVLPMEMRLESTNKVKRRREVIRLRNVLYSKANFPLYGLLIRLAIAVSERSIPVIFALGKSSVK